MNNSFEKLISELNKGKVLCYNRNKSFEKFFKRVADKYYYSFDCVEWNATFIDVTDKISKQFESFTVGGK